MGEREIIESYMEFKGRRKIWYEWLWDQTNRKTDKQTSKQTSKQTNKQTNKQRQKTNAIFPDQCGRIS